MYGEFILLYCFRSKFISRRVSYQKNNPRPYFTGIPHFPGAEDIAAGMRKAAEEQAPLLNKIKYFLT